MSLFYLPAPQCPCGLFQFAHLLAHFSRLSCSCSITQSNLLPSLARRSAVHRLIMFYNSIESPSPHLIFKVLATWFLLDSIVLLLLVYCFYEISSGLLQALAFIIYAHLGSSRPIPFACDCISCFSCACLLFLSLASFASNVLSICLPAFVLKRGQCPSFGLLFVRITLRACFMYHLLGMLVSKVLAFFSLVSE